MTSTSARLLRLTLSTALAAALLCALAPSAPARALKLKRTTVLSVDQEAGRLGYVAQKRRGSGCRRGSVRRGRRPCRDAFLLAPGGNVRKITRAPSGGRVPGYEALSVGSDQSLLTAEFACDDRECASGAQDQVLVQNATRAAANVGGLVTSQSSSGGSPQTVADVINGAYIGLVDVCNAEGDSSGCEDFGPPAYFVRFALVPGPATLRAGGVLDIGVKCAWSTTGSSVPQVAVSGSGDGAFIAAGRLVRAAGGACLTVDTGSLDSPAFEGSTLVYARRGDVHVVDTGAGTNRVAGSAPVLGFTNPRNQRRRDSGFALGNGCIAWHEHIRRGRRTVNERIRLMHLASGRLEVFGVALSRRVDQPDRLTAPAMDGSTLVFAENGARTTDIERAVISCGP